MTTALTGIPRAYSPYGVGSYIRFFDTQTDTPKDVFSDSDLGTPIDDEDLVADAASTFPVIFLSPSLYRIKIYDADDVLKVLVDDYDPALPVGTGVTSAVPIVLGGTGATTAELARANLSVPSNDTMSAAQDDITELQTQIAPGLNGSDVLGTAAAQDTGTSGATVPLLNGNNTYSGTATFSSTSGISARNTLKAWASFSVTGTTVSFTAANYFNIASITRTGEGTFTVAFTSNLPTANYVVVGGGTSEGASTEGSVIYVSSKATTGFTLKTQRINTGAGDNDPAYCDFMVLGF